MSTNSDMRHLVNTGNSLVSSLSSVFVIAAKKINVTAVTNVVKTQVVGFNGACFDIDSTIVSFSNGRVIRLSFDKRSFFRNPNRIQCNIMDKKRPDSLVILPYIEYEPESGTFVYYPDKDFDQLAALARTGNCSDDAAWKDTLTLEVCRQFITSGITG